MTFFHKFFLSKNFIVSLCSLIISQEFVELLVLQTFEILLNNLSQDFLSKNVIVSLCSMIISQEFGVLLVLQFFLNLFIKFNLIFAVSFWSTIVLKQLLKTFHIIVVFCSEYNFIRSFWIIFFLELCNGSSFFLIFPFKIFLVVMKFCWN